MKTHYVSVTGIIRKNDTFLICKRSPTEKALPNKWCVPGGKVEVQDFVNTPKDTDSHWFDLLEKTLRKEIKEETNLTIKNTGYVSSLGFLRDNGHLTIIVSMHADHAGGEVVLQEDELVDYAWVSIDELNSYDLIDNIKEQIIKVHKMKSQQTPSISAQSNPA